MAMKVYTDDRLFAGKKISDVTNWRPLDCQLVNKPYQKHILKKIFPSHKKIYMADDETEFWKEIYIVKHSKESQFEMARQISGGSTPLADGIVFLAGSGDNFKGFRNRSWTASPGNLHLTVHFAPNKPIENFLAGFLSLAAISVVQTIRKIDSLQKEAGIRWVNDIVLGNAKVGGVLTHTQSKGNQITSALLGIGINIATVPVILPDIFVPKATSIHTFLKEGEKVTSGSVLNNLLDYLRENYKILLDQGSGVLVEKYRWYSTILGKHVRVYSDPVSGKPELFAEGKADKIGDNLELILEDNPDPVIKGRLAQ